MTPLEILLIMASVWLMLLVLLRIMLTRWIFRINKIVDAMEEEKNELKEIKMLLSAIDNNTKE